MAGETGRLKTKGMSWAQRWFQNHGYDNISRKQNLFYGTKNGATFGIYVAARDHKTATKPFEPIMFQLSDARSIQKQFSVVKVTRGVIVIARGFRESANSRKDLSYFVKVPFPVLERFILNRTHKSDNPTINIGFDETQKKKWMDEGVEFIPMYTETPKLPVSQKKNPDSHYKATMDSKIFDSNITKTEMEQLIKSRIGQSDFRKKLLMRDKKCVICGISHSPLLVASHIKPWKVSTHEERLDPSNGILLCSVHDSLFDKGYISFQDNGAILLSPVLDEDISKAYNVKTSDTIILSKYQKPFMEEHRKSFFEKN